MTHASNKTDCRQIDNGAAVCIQDIDVTGTSGREELQVDERGTECGDTSKISHIVFSVRRRVLLTSALEPSLGTNRGR